MKNTISATIVAALIALPSFAFAGEPTPAPAGDKPAATEKAPAKKAPKAAKKKDEKKEEKKEAAPAPAPAPAK